MIIAISGNPPEFVRCFQQLELRYFAWNSQMSLIEHMCNLQNDGEQPKDKDLRKAIWSSFACGRVAITP